MGAYENWAAGIAAAIRAVKPTLTDQYALKQFPWFISKLYSSVPEPTASKSLPDLYTAMAAQIRAYNASSGTPAMPANTPAYDFARYILAPDTLMFYPDWGISGSGGTTYIPNPSAGETALWKQTPSSNTRIFVYNGTSWVNYLFVDTTPASDYLTYVRKGYHDGATLYQTPGSIVLGGGSPVTSVVSTTPALTFTPPVQFPTDATTYNITTSSSSYSLQYSFVYQLNNTTYRWLYQQLVSGGTGGYYHMNYTNAAGDDVSTTNPPAGTKYIEYFGIQPTTGVTTGAVSVMPVGTGYTYNRWNGSSWVNRGTWNSPRAPIWYYTIASNFSSSPGWIAQGYQNTWVKDITDGVRIGFDAVPPALSQTDPAIYVYI